MEVGRIELIVGPMFAGKTTEMLRRICRAELARKKCCVIKFSKDIRYSVEKVSTHDLLMHDAIPCSDLMSHMDECLAYDVIGIDEGQFFSDIVEFAEILANKGKAVIAAALDGTFQRKPFGKVLELISKCEAFTKLTAICRITGEEAPFTQRTVQSTELELIGGEESYTASSRSVIKGIKTSGQINLIIGPVKAGKTTELLRLLNRHEISGKKVLFMKPKSSIDPHFLKLKAKSIDTLPTLEELSSYDVIGLDDAHKLKGVSEWADNLADHNKLVIISALDGNAERIPYQEIINLLPLCENSTKIDSICYITGLPAPFSMLNKGATMIPISRLGIMTQHSLNFV